MALSDERIKLPGFGLPMQHTPPLRIRLENGENKRGRFPHAIADYFSSAGVKLRERRMLDFIDKITDKPEWDRKVFDEAILGKWHEEACRYSEELRDDYLSERMWKYVGSHSDLIFPAS
jgi:hypothetical protein